MKKLFAICAALVALSCTVTETLEQQPLENSVVYEMNVRQYTPEGTFSAAQRELPRLAELGVDIVWLMPIYPIGVEGRKGTLGSYYAVKNYCDINPEFGTLEDFDNFVAEAHRLGLRVVIDWVANHTSPDAVWVTGQAPEWYERDAEGNTTFTADWSDTANLNYENKDVWKGMQDALRFWMERGIDGFRCDMACEVPLEFWQETIAGLRADYPEMYWLAEGEEPLLHSLSDFDASYSWELHHMMNAIARGEKNIPELLEYIAKDAERHPADAFRLMFTSNHDENSWSGSEFTRFGEALNVMTALTFLWESSMPLIYTGQEVGYDHSFEFFDKDPIPCYQANEQTDFYRKLIALKHSQKALQAGERGGRSIEIENNAKDCIMTFVREVEDSRVVAILNLSPYTIHANFNTGIYAGDYTNAIDGCSQVLPMQFERDLAPWEFIILHK